MSPDREDLHREIDAVTDHPRAFAEAILDYTPTIARHGCRLSIVFDISDQASDAFDLLWHAINNVRMANTERKTHG